jgi:HAD superfamily hydrolase (TIGR01549 family)
VEAIVFDLDQTLVDSSPLAEFRKAGAWATVLSRLGEVTSFESDPHGLPALAQSMGYKTGVVTSGAGHYAQALLEQFAIQPDALVTGSDEYPPKPDPAGLLAVLGELGVDPSQAAYVGDDPFDFEAAAQAGMRSVGALWAWDDGRAPESWTRHWPDLALRSPSAVLEIDNWAKRSLLAEATIVGESPDPHRGSIIPYRFGLSLGRYFTTTDKRADQPLTVAVLRNKHASPDAEAFAAAIQAVIPAWPVAHGAVVTAVPPSPEEEFDRFEVARSVAATAASGWDRPSILKQKFPVEEYKHAHGPEERDALNQDRFSVQEDVKDQTVLLLDDVFTTGSQLRACRTKLLEAGAARVATLTIAHAQEPLLRNCPQCGKGILKYRISYRGPFWGCSRWRRDGSGCGYLEDAS